MQVASIQEACGPRRNSAKELMMLAGDVAMVTAPWASQDRDRMGFSGWSESLHNVSGLGGTEPVGAPPASDPAQKEQTGNPPAAGIPGMRADWAMQGTGDAFAPMVSENPEKDRHGDFPGGTDQLPWWGAVEGWRFEDLTFYLEGIKSL